MRTCELCECAARMYCESDQASLCWDCDEKVHRANFLVAKHSRSLLCHVCQSLTPWKASGTKLGHTVSVCDACVTVTRCGVSGDKIVQQENQSEGSSGDIQNHPAVDETDDDEDDFDADDEEDDDDDLDVEEEDENQVVPWSGDSQSPHPPPLSSASCSSISEEDVSLKRMRDFADLYSDDEIGSSSLPGSRGVANEEATSHSGSFRPLKLPRTTTERDDHGQADSKSTAIVSTIQRLQSQMITNDLGASATIIGICRLSGNESR